MFVKRALAATFLGVSSYVLAGGLTLVFLLVTYNIYDRFDLNHARHPLQITLAIFVTVGSAVVAAATIIGLPLLVARRLHANVLAAIFVGGLLVGISAHAFMVGISSWNKCSLQSSIPYASADYCE
jgi:hypothetical protein